MLKFLFRAILVLVALALAVLAWDVWQLRRLRPPEVRTFEGFLRDGRQGSLRIDDGRCKLYWITSQKTIVRYSEPVIYEFDRSGVLLNWTPGTGEGMMVGTAVVGGGREATVGEARAWLRTER